MSTLSQFSGGGVKQIKTGFILNAAPSVAAPGSVSSEDFFYRDITLSGDPIGDITKCVVVFDGVGHYSDRGPLLNSNISTSTTYNTHIVTARLQNTTTLRLCHQVDSSIGTSSSAYYYTTGRWTIIEYR